VFGIQYVKRAAIEAKKKIYLI